MALLEQRIQDITRPGTDVQFVQMVNPNVDQFVFINDGYTIFYIRNTGTANRTVTIPTIYREDGLNLAERTIVIPAGEERIIGPLRPGIYNTPIAGSTVGRVMIRPPSGGGHADLQVAALRFVPFQ